MTGQETFSQRVLRQALARREELLAGIREELAQVEAIIAALTGQRPEGGLLEPTIPPEPEAPAPPEPELAGPSPTPPKPRKPRRPARGAHVAEEGSPDERKRRVMQYILDHGPATVPELSDALAIKGDGRKRLRTLVRQMADREGILKIVDTRKSTGRPSPVFDVVEGATIPSAPEPSPSTPEANKLDVLKAIGEAVEHKLSTARLRAALKRAKAGALPAGLINEMVEAGELVRTRERDGDGFPVIALPGVVPSRAPAEPHPGLEPEEREELPEHLKKMPAASMNKPVSVKVPIVEFQYQVFKTVDENSPIGATVVADKIGGDRSDKTFQGRTAKHLRELEAAGLIARTGRNVRAPWQKAGRAAVEYKRIEGALEGVEVEEKEEPSPPRPSVLAPEGGVPTQEDIRDVVVKMPPGPFSPAQVIARANLDATSEVGWGLDTVRARLGQLAGKGVVTDKSPSRDLVLFEYQKPEGPGSAAEAQKRLGISGGGESSGTTVTEGQPRGRAVAGTGRQGSISNPDVRKLIEDVRQAGCKAELAGSGHWEITLPGSGKRLLVSNTPRNQRSVLNDRTRLKRNGVNIA